MARRANAGQLPVAPPTGLPTAEAQREPFAGAPAFLRTPTYYIRVLKPRETLLLIIMGTTTAIVAGEGAPPVGRLLLAVLAVALGSGGTNGLTNYLDRDVDARMRRTRRRVLPAGRLAPAHALAWSAALVAAGLAIAWWLDPLAALLAGVCVATSVIFRKTWATHLLGAVSSCGPVLVGWFAIDPHVTPAILLLCAAVLFWEPAHVWNLMIAYREDYLRAGVDIFPLDRGARLTERISLCLTAMMSIMVVALWWYGGFSPLFLVLALGGALLMLRAAWQALRQPVGARAHRVFRLSAYPFLGALFFGMVLDVWVRMSMQA